MWLFETVAGSRGRARKAAAVQAPSRSPNGTTAWRCEFVAPESDTGLSYASANAEPKLDLCTHLPTELRRRVLSTGVAEQVNRSITLRERVRLPPELGAHLARALRSLRASYGALQAQLRACEPAQQATPSATPGPARAPYNAPRPFAESKAAGVALGMGLLG